MGVGMGTASEALKRVTGLSDSKSNFHEIISNINIYILGESLVFSGPNVQRIVNRLSRMRGAALKLGQMLSIQGIIFFR